MISWQRIRMTNRLKYMRDRNLSYIEVDIAEWHYWVFYFNQPVIESELNAEGFLIEAVFFSPCHYVQAVGGNSALENNAFDVPGTWLKDANGILYQLLEEEILKRNPLR